MVHEVLFTNKVLIGEGAVKEAAPIWKKIGKKVLLVTDPTMQKLGNVDMLRKILEEEDIEVSVYAEISGEPTDTMIEKGCEIYQKDQCEYLIGFGGGSAIDSMKAIGAMVVNGGSICDYNGKVFTKPLPHMTAIPTTAGTGSETTQFTIINDTKNNIKMLLKGEVLMPNMAVIDPEFTLSLPAKITASTGMDAFTHAVEAYTSRKASPLSDVFALSAFSRIVKYLPEALNNGKDVKAREELSIAAFEAGVAFNNSSVTVVHGMSRPIGALFHVPHGISNAMLDIKCFQYVLDGAVERFAELARYVKAAQKDDDDSSAADKFLDIVKNLCKICEIPTLEEYGIDKEKYFENIDKMTKDALDSGSPQNTRKSLNENDIKKIYASLWD